MRLLQRTSRYYLLISLGLFTLIGVILFTILRKTLTHELDEGLEHTSVALHRQLERMDSLPARVEIMDEIVELQPIERFTGYRRYADTTFFDDRPGELEYEPYRKYTYEDRIRGQAYRITLYHSTVDNQDIAGGIGLALVIALGLGLIVFNLLTRRLNRHLWRPFQRSLEQIGDFDVRREEVPCFAASDTQEFNDLNRSLERLTARMVGDYQSLRRFTENASHELQTPLAIIRNQIDLLLREEERSETDYAILQRLSESVSRLRKLNQSLLLLAKIERGQVPEAAWIDLRPLVERKLEQLEPALKERKIRLTKQLETQQVMLPPTLADVLLNNLLSNAIRHNVDGGDIHVYLGDDILRIENSGTPLTQAPERLFERFSKGSNSSESLGLGLAIVKEIGDKYGGEVTYAYAQGRHRLQVRFQS